MMSIIYLETLNIEWGQIDTKGHRGLRGTDKRNSVRLLQFHRFSTDGSTNSVSGFTSGSGLFLLSFNF